MESNCNDQNGNKLAIFKEEKIMVRLIVSDIDGTLVNEDRSMTERTRTALERLHEKGILFGIASGRPVYNLRRFKDRWGLSYPFDVVIGMNGAELWDESTQNIYTFNKMKKEWIKEILDMMSVFGKQANPYIYSGDHILSMWLDENTKLQEVRNQMDVVAPKDPSDFYQEDTPKLLFRIPEELMPDAEHYASMHLKYGYKSVRTGKTILEFVHKDTEKMHGLIKYCSLHDIDIRDTMAFGDAPNDYGIIKTAGIGICMKNGDQKVKEIADIILNHTNEEDGVAIYLEENVL